MTGPRAFVPAAFDALVEELLVADVHVGFAEQRAELARRLADDGVTAEDVALLARHCAETVSGAAAAARVLVSLLTDPAKREPRLADLRAAQDAKSRRAAEKARAPGDAPARPFAGPTDGEPREVWEHDRKCRIAWCRVNSDRRTVEEVAAELGVKTGTLTAMLDRGRQLSESPLPKARPGLPSPSAAAKATGESQDRLREFRQRMRTDAAMRQRGTKEPPQWRFDLIRRESERIVARLRETGVVELADVMRDPVRRGALATLEADGVILRDGPPDERGQQPYRLARNEQERAEFRAALQAWNLRPRQPRAEATA